jgi:hypothetical protein
VIAVRAAHPQNQIDFDRAGSRVSFEAIEKRFGAGEPPALHMR